MQRTGPSKRLIVMVVVDTLGRSPCLATEDARQAERDFETLVQPLLGPALRLAVAMLGDRSAAEDAVQEATLRTWRHLDQFREGSCLRSWYLADEGIARLTGVRVGTVKSRLHRATVRLRARLDAPAAAP